MRVYRSISKFARAAKRFVWRVANSVGFLSFRIFDPGSGCFPEVSAEAGV